MLTTYFMILLAFVLVFILAPAGYLMTRNAHRRRYLRSIAKQVGWCLCGLPADPHPPH